MSDEAIRNPSGIKEFGALDFACPKPNGESWDFCRAKDRMEAWRLLEECDPDWVVGSPPCTAFSLLNHGLNYPKMDQVIVTTKIAEVLIHLKLVCAMYKRQIKRGKWFLHGHPRSATSWHCDAIKRILRMPGVSTSVMDQCMYGCTSIGPDKQHTPALKHTRWMINSPEMLEMLTRKCDKSHKHQHLKGGRAAAAAFFIFQLCFGRS